MWIFGYLQLCVYGAWAAISGDFDLSFRLNEAFESQENYAKQDLNHHYFQPQSFATSPAATQRSFKVASGTFATSRIILLLQYAIVLHFAKKHKRQLAPIYCNMLGCLLSGAFWFTAMGLSFRDSEGVRIARIVLWVVGLAVEFGGMVVAAVVQPGLRLDLEYWAERFSALTLIVLGEGSELRSRDSHLRRAACADSSGLITSIQSWEHSHPSRRRSTACTPGVGADWATLQAAS